MKFWLINHKFSERIRCFQSLSQINCFYNKINQNFGEFKIWSIITQNQSMSGQKTKSKASGQSVEKEIRKREDINVRTCVWTQRYDNNNGFRQPIHTICTSNQTNGLNAATGHSSNSYAIDEDINCYGFPYPTQYYQPFYGFPRNRLPYAMSRRTVTNKCTQTSKEDQIREQVLKCRSFIRTRLYDKNELSSDGFEFSIMTYNILSQDLLEFHSSLYQHCEHSSISWPERGHRIIRELLESDADIICLQEVHSQHFNELLMPALRDKGYNFVFKRKTGAKLDGCAVVYKENMFSLLNTIKLELMRIDLSSILDRDNIGLIVELKPKLSKHNSKLIVANTHLLFNPRRGDVKIAQMRLLLAEIDKMAVISSNKESYDYNPIILCGDLNSEPNSLLYNFIVKGLANFEGLKVGDISGQRDGFGKGKDMSDYHLKLLGVTADSRFESPLDNIEIEVKEKMSIKHNFKFKSVINRFTNKLGERLISTSNCFESGLVDYIFYDYRKLKLLGFQELLTQNQMTSIGRIPNAYLGSDHLSLKAKFHMN